MPFDSRHRKPGRLALILAVTALAATGLFADPTPQRVRLELASGSMVVLGPVQSRDGLLFFHTLDGRLASVPEKLVRRSVPLGGPGETPAETEARTTPAPRTLTNQDLPADPAPPDEAFTNDDLSAAGAPSAGDTYTNAELPVIEESAPEEPVAEGEDAGEEPADPAPSEPDPAAADAAPAADLGAAIEELDARITLAEQEESLYFRLLVCAQNGIPLNGKDCHPDLGLRPNPSANPSPSERSLMAKMAAAQLQARESREERERLVEEAGRAGVALPGGESAPGSEP